MNNLTQILDEIAELSQPPRLADGEFTTAMFAEHANLSTRIAAGRLDPPRWPPLLGLLPDW